MELIFGREVYPDAIAVQSMSNRYAIGESRSGSKMEKQANIDFFYWN
jgi:hypothetical protein